MGEEFTFQNVRVAVQGIVNYLKKRFPGQHISVIVNYDTRFLSERFANEAAKVLSHNKVQVYLADRDAPSQAQSYQIIKRKVQAGINFTASFNPPEYNGLKFNTETGAPAMPEVTDDIEEEIEKLQGKLSFCPYYPKSEFIEEIDLQNGYLTFIQGKIDFDAIRASNMKIAVDLLYGTSREYLDEILEENNIEIEEIHGYVDPYFGGVIPSCTEENLSELKKLVRDQKCHLGIATDADGDRFGIVDEKGRFISPNLVLSLILDYLVTKKGWRGGVARSVATTHLIDRIAREHSLSLFRTPVGFKYIADLFLRGKIMFGGEESACIVLKDHLPEKDGIIAGLLVAEIIATSGKSLSILLEELFQKYGRRVYCQRYLPLTPVRKRKLEKLLNNPPAKFGERQVLNFQTIDGIKLDFEGDDWILFRFSGTEPGIRYYAEAGTKEDLKNLESSGMEFFS